MSAGPPPSNRRAAHADRGAALLIAIGFVVLVGGIAAGLAALITSGVGNRVQLENIRDRQYAADAAIEKAIVDVRQLPRDAVPVCAITDSLNGVTIRVDCAPRDTVVADNAGTLFAQRNVVFDACVDTGVACTAGTAIVHAEINFEQKYGGQVTRTYVQLWSVSR